MAIAGTVYTSGHVYAYAYELVHTRASAAVLAGVRTISAWHSNVVAVRVQPSVMFAQASTCAARYNPSVNFLYRVVL